MNTRTTSKNKFLSVLVALGIIVALIMLAYFSLQAQRSRQETTLSNQTSMSTFSTSNFSSFNNNSSNSTYSNPTSSTKLLHFLQNITVGQNPSDVLYDLGNGLVYVANNWNNSISVIDPKTNTVKLNITLSIPPRHLLYDPENGIIYVAPSRTSTGAAINGSTNTVLKLIVGLEDGGLTYDSSARYVYGVGNGGVVVVNTTSNTIVRNISVVGIPSSLAYDPNNGNVYVTINNGTDSLPQIGVIDPVSFSVVKYFSLAGGAAGHTLGIYEITFDSSNGLLYASDPAGINVINGTSNTVVRGIYLYSAGGYALDTSRGIMYVTGGTVDFALDAVYAVDSHTNSIIDSLRCNCSAYSIALDPLNGELYVANVESNSVSVIST